MWTSLLKRVSKLRKSLIAVLVIGPPLEYELVGADQWPSQGLLVGRMIKISTPGQLVAA